MTTKVTAASISLSANDPPQYLVVPTFTTIPDDPEVPPLPPPTGGIYVFVTLAEAQAFLKSGFEGTLPPPP